MDLIKQYSYLHSSLNKYGTSIYEKPIFRFIPFDRLTDILINNATYISPVTSWEDTYENWLIKASFKSKSTRISFKEFLSGYFGQCWTTSKETDALWRIYSADKNSVKIKSTISDLLSSELNLDNFKDYSTITKIMGQVSYLNRNQIINWLDHKKREIGIINSQILLDSQFIKRREFIHEKEFRLIISCSDTTKDDKKRDHLIIKVEPNKFIHEVVFDPRLDDRTFYMRSKLISKLGYKNRIKKSSLYSFKPLTVNIV